MAYGLIGSPVVPVCYETRLNNFRSYIFTAGNVGGTGVAYFNIIKAANQLRFLFENFYDANGLTGDTYQPGTSAALTILASMEDPLNIGNVFCQLTFNGGQASTVLAYGGRVWSDPVDYDAPAGLTIPLRVNVSGTAGSTMPNMAVMTPQNLYVSNVGSAYGYNGADTSTYGNNYVTDGGAGTNQLATAGRAWVVVEANPELYTASGVFGQVVSTTPQPVVGIVGDSIAMGYADYGFGELGWIMRYLRANGVPSVNLSAVAETMQAASLPANYRIRRGYEQFMTHAIVQYGINDVVTGGASLASLKSYAKIVYQGLVNRGIKVYASTLPPVTTSTDNWVTAGNQTVKASEAVRTGWNDFLRSWTAGSTDPILSLLSGVFDAAKPVEVNASNVFTIDGGRWYCGPSNNTAYVSTDGVHPLPAANLLMQACIPANKFTVSSYMSTIYNAAVAANVTTAPQVYTVTSPGSSVAVEATGTFSVLSDVGFIVAYAVSIDGGATYGAYTSCLEVMPLVPTNSELVMVLPTTKDVDHVAFVIQNRNQANAISNVKLTVSG